MPRHDDSMVNTEGRAYAITTLAPMKWWRAWGLRIFFWIRRLGFFPGESKKLKRLSFIHFARWVIIPGDGFPNLGHGQPRERLEYDYLLFCSNFNGSWDQYIDAFSHVVPVGMDLTFGWCEKYPRSVPTTPFKRYIRSNQLETDYYYTAYPHATTNDVKQALHLSAELREFADAVKQMSPEQFLREYHQFLVQVQNDLSESGPDSNEP